MNRTISILIQENLVERDLPGADTEVLPGVKWGEPWVLFTPAYWVTQAWMAEIDSKPSKRNPTKDGVVDELGFCMLGGFGITAELATAAFERCSQAGLFARYETSSDAWRAELSAPLQVGPRLIKYRYPNQKSSFLAAAMEFVRTNQLRTDSGIALREQLMTIKGVGFKIASWVARNVLDSDEVAILNIHLIRAGQLCGLFSPDQRVDRHYREMEVACPVFCTK